MFKMNSIDKINKLDKSDFLAIFGNVFEKTEWIAKKVFNLKPFNSLDDLFSKMTLEYENCGKNDILKILNAHPDLVVEKKLTKDSEKEQSNANLNNCTLKEFKEFKELNLKYKKKFNFPFIIAVSGKSRTEILKKFRYRINNSVNKEFDEAKNQVKKIAIIRLNNIINN